MDRQFSDADPLRDSPCAYFITFHTYGTWLHGTDRGSVLRARNEPGTPVLEGDPTFEESRWRVQRREAFVLSTRQRGVVERTVREVCAYRGWELHGLNVRTNHVHIIVSSFDMPERLLRDFKAYATRRLREAGLVFADQVVWARHGSTRYLWNERSVALACEYVREGQDSK